jgi:hypothetical protein
VRLTAIPLARPIGKTISVFADDVGAAVGRSTIDHDVFDTWVFLA